MVANHISSMTNPSAKWLDLRELSSAIAGAPLSELPHMLGQLRELEILAQMRLHAESRTTTPHASDEIVDAKEASRRLGISRISLYRRASKLPDQPFRHYRLAAGPLMAFTLDRVQHHARVVSAIRVLQARYIRSDRRFNGISSALVSPRPIRHKAWNVRKCAAPKL